jgi:serine-type D-Ala-D-Ala carboxypeptidase/endopeptidase
MQLKKILPLIFLASPLFLFSQGPPDKSEVEKIFSSYLADSNNTGLTVGLIFDDSARIYCFGRRDRLDTDKVSDSTIFEIGSITKTFTAVLFSEKILRHEMSLQDPIDKYLPDSIKLRPEMQNQINLFSLVTHTSGLPRLPGDLTQHISFDTSKLKIDYSIKEFYAYLQQYSSKRKAGKYVNYSNFGIGLLGHLLEQESKEGYDSLVIKNVCSPLQMKHTKIKPDAEENKMVATGYSKGKAAPGWGFEAFEGAGALRSDMKDMMLYLRSNIYRTGDTLSSAIFSTHNRLHKFSRHNDIGMCWIILKGRKGMKTCWHNGATAGFRSFIGFDDQQKYGVVILANSDASLDTEGFAMLEMLKQRSKKK